MRPSATKLLVYATKLLATKERKAAYAGDAYKERPHCQEPRQRQPRRRPQVYSKLIYIVYYILIYIVNCYILLTFLLHSPHFFFVTFTSTLFSHTPNTHHCSTSANVPTPRAGARSRDLSLFPPLPHLKLLLHEAFSY